MGREEVRAGVTKRAGRRESRENCGQDVIYEKRINKKEKYFW